MFEKSIFAAFYCAIIFAHIKKQSDKILVIRNESFFVNKSAYLVDICPFDFSDFLLLQNKAVDINILFNKINKTIREYEGGTTIYNETGGYYDFGQELD